MHAHAQTARAMRRSIKEHLVHVEQAIDACREQAQLAAALEGKQAQVATLGALEVSVLALAQCAAEAGAIPAFQDPHGR